jgi:hypothetical protein
MNTPGPEPSLLLSSPNWTIWTAQGLTWAAMHPQVVKA